MQSDKCSHVQLQDYNLSAIRVLASGRLSLLKKMKRKVGYEQDTEDTGLEAENAMKKLCLAEWNGVQTGDISMQAL